MSEQKKPQGILGNLLPKPSSEAPKLELPKLPMLGRPWRTNWRAGWRYRRGTTV